MFRTVLPRATPRAALRAAGPKAVPSTFITPPMVFIGRSKRGYASDAGEFEIWMLLSNDRSEKSALLGFLDILTLPASPGLQQLSTIWSSLVAVSLVTLLLSRPAKRV